MGITLGLIGYGEVGSIFGRQLRAQTGVDAVVAWDLRFADAQHAAAAQADGVGPVGGMAALCARADLLISAVTASSTLTVAQEAARHARAGTRYLDLNSASPGTKMQAAAVLQAVGVGYVEAGVMTSVPPYGIRVPLLLSGPHAADMAVTLQAWGMDASVVSARYGIASAIKMSRSVMIKGLEALVIESYTTARHYGVEEHVLPTLQETFPQIDWAQQGSYFFSRVVQHGKRRAEEMFEAAATVREAGIAPLMASAIAHKQAGVAQQAAAGLFDGVGPKAPWQAYADRLLAQAKEQGCAR